LVLRGGRWGRTRLAVRYGVFTHPREGLVLIDAGWATARPGDSLALRLYHALMPAQVQADQSPALLKPARVLLSHLHADHVGCLRDLPPDIPVHANTTAWTRAVKGGLGVLRHAVFPELLASQTVIGFDQGPPVELPYGLGSGHDLFGDGSVLTVPLPGHADGHTGFLFPAFDPPVLYAADAQWVLAALAPGKDPRGPLRRVYSDPSAVPGTIEKIRTFRDAGGVAILSHDPDPAPEFQA
jgi:glyoxylase-like metal-dependent hydrolase (beta-lactamase superfamily II)